ncbi:MAG: universal stress protein [Verrucomicrobiota bacterium]
MNAKTILAAVDFSDVTPRLLEAAAAMAKAFDGRIILLYVEEPEPEFVGFEAGPQPVRVSVAHEARASHRQLEQLKQQLAGEQFDVVALHIQGSSVEKILWEAREQAVDLIVIGSHGHGAFYNLLVGSVASGVLKGTPCPVLVVPAPGK